MGHRMKSKRNSCQRQGWQQKEKNTMSNNSIDNNNEELQQLVGKFFLTFKGGKMDWQGKIIGTVKDAALCQLFSWPDGYPSNQVLLRYCDLLSDPGYERVKLFDDEDQWRDKSSAINRQTFEQIRESIRKNHHGRVGHNEA
jgi:hypothetical protein